MINNGIKVLQHVEKDIRVREERMKQHKNEQSVRILSICMPPALNWDRKFQEVKTKMDESIGKLSNTLITVQLTHLRFNSCFMSKFYFGCRKIIITDAQDAELRQACERPLARKL